MHGNDNENNNLWIPFLDYLGKYDCFSRISTIREHLKNTNYTVNDWKKPIETEKFQGVAPICLLLETMTFCGYEVEDIFSAVNDQFMVQGEGLADLFNVFTGPFLALFKELCEKKDFDFLLKPYEAGEKDFGSVTGFYWMIWLMDMKGHDGDKSIDNFYAQWNSIVKTINKEFGDHSIPYWLDERIYTHSQDRLYTNSHLLEGPPFRMLVSSLDYTDQSAEYFQDTIDIINSICEKIDDSLFVRVWNKQTREEHMRGANAFTWLIFALNSYSMKLCEKESEDSTASELEKRYNMILEMIISVRNRLAGILNDDDELMRQWLRRIGSESIKTPFYLLVHSYSCYPDERVFDLIQDNHSRLNEEWEDMTVWTTKIERDDQNNFEGATSFFWLVYTFLNEKSNAKQLLKLIKDIHQQLDGHQMNEVWMNQVKKDGYPRGNFRGKSPLKLLVENCRDNPSDACQEVLYEVWKNKQLRKQLLDAKDASEKRKQLIEWLNVKEVECQVGSTYFWLKKITDSERTLQTTAQEKVSDDTLKKISLIGHTEEEEGAYKSHNEIFTIIDSLYQDAVDNRIKETVKDVVDELVNRLSKR